MKLLAALLLFVSVNVFGQHEFSGSIKDEKGNPISGAFVSFVGPSTKTLITSEKGTFKFKELKDGLYILNTSCLGYRQMVDTIQIVASASKDVTMLPNALDLSFVEIIGSNPNGLREVAGTATKLDLELIQLVQPVGTQEILEKVPGLVAATDDGLGNSRISVGIRGLDPRRSSRVLLLEDGIPVQPAPYIYPNAYYNPPVERIKEIEVIKGASSIQYGPQTMGGIINYITSKPRSELGGKVQLMGGNYNSRSVFAEVGGFGNKKLHPEVQLLYKSSDGFRQNNHFEQVNGTLKFDYVHSENTNFYLKLNADKELSNATYTGLTEYSFRTDPTFNPKKHDVFDVLRLSADGGKTKRINDNLLVADKAYFVYFDRKWWRENDVFVLADSYKEGDSIVPVPYYTEGNLIRVGNGKNNFGNLRTFYNLGYQKSVDYEHNLGNIKANLEAGARIHWEKFLDSKVIGNTPDARTGVYYTTKPDGSVNAIVGSASNYETTSLALYATEKLRFGSRLSVDPGIRLEAFEQEHINRLEGNKYSDKVTIIPLPGVGFNYAFENMNIFGGYHRGFTPPQSGTMLIVQARGNIDLKAERGQNAELGFRGNFKWIEFEEALFYLRINDFVAAAKGTVFQNLGTVDSKGLESNIRVNLSSIEKLSFLPDLYLIHTFMNAEVVDASMVSALPPAGTIVDLKGKKIPYTPDMIFTAGVRKDFKNGLKIMAEMKFNDAMFTDYENIVRSENRGDQGMIQAFTIYNAAINYTCKEKWQFGLSGKNLADKIYIASRLHSNPSQPDPNISSGIFIGPRRQISLSATYYFGKN